jgi:hypothetical protein
LRRLATSSGEDNCFKASMVAFTALWGLWDPRHLVRTFLMPATSTTARTGPPAMTPVPSEAGFYKTLPEPNSPTTA